MKRLPGILVLLLAVTTPLSASTRVVTSIPDLADLVRQVGKDRVDVEYIVRGDQNPHYVEVKPSYMMKLKSADVFFIVGMDLELWSQQLIDGSRNTSLLVVDLSREIKKLEVPVGTVDAREGDVHRYGNPHYWLDPRNIRTMLEEIVVALARISPSDEEFFRANAAAYERLLDQKIQEWEEQIHPLAGQKILTFHRSWSYFAAWTGIVVADQIEPKPGIPPSPSHTADLISLVRRTGIKVIIVEPYYDTGAADQIARSTGATVVRLPVSVGGVPEARDYISMISYNVRMLFTALHG